MNSAAEVFSPPAANRRGVEGRNGGPQLLRATSEAPFGGTNFSGMGREGGVEGLHDYLDVKLAQVVF